jgi:MFS family permease
MNLQQRDDGRYVVAIVSGAHFLSHVFLLAYAPLFPLLGPEFDVTTAQLGLLVTMVYVPTLLFQLPLGELVDRVGAKRVLAAGVGVASLGIVSSGLAPTYPGLLACAFVSGIGQSVFHPSDYALLETVTEERNEGKAFSVHTFGGFAGFAVAPAVVGGLGIRYGWRAAFVVVGSVGFAYAAVLYLTTASVHARRIRAAAEADGERSGGNETSLFAVLSLFFQRELALVFCFYLVSMMGFIGLQTFTAVFAIRSFGFGESGANTVLTAHLALTAVGVVTGGPLADARSAGRVIVATLGLAAAGVVLAVVGAPHVGFAGAVALFSAVGLCLGVALPSRDKLANSFADAESTGKSFGFFFTGLSTGAVISPPLLGSVIDAVSLSAALALIAVFLAAAAGVVVAIGGPSGFKSRRG